MNKSNNWGDGPRSDRRGGLPADSAPRTWESVAQTRAEARRNASRRHQARLAREREIKRSREIAEAKQEVLRLRSQRELIAAREAARQQQHSRAPVEAERSWWGEWKPVARPRSGKSASAGSTAKESRSPSAGSPSMRSTVAGSTVPASRWARRAGEDAAPPADGTRPGRRTRGILVNVTLVASLLLLCGLGVLWAVDPGSQPNSPQAAPPPDPSSAAASYVPPASAPDPGVLVHSALTPGGDLVVRQWLAFGVPTGRLPLRVHPAAIGAPDDDAVLVRDLQVVADGETVDTQVAELGSGDSVLLDLDGQTSSVRLDYVIEGVVERSSAAEPGRAVVDLNAVRVRMTEGVRVVQVTTGATGSVLSMACGSGRVFATSCGRTRGGDWSVRLPDATTDTDVIAAVDLPTA